MADLSNLIETLKRYEFNKKQELTDDSYISMKRTVTDKNIGIVEVKQNIDSTINKKLLGDNSEENKNIRKGLANKFVLYKPDAMSSQTINKDKDPYSSNTLHAGLYYCDGQQNMYMLSPDLNFYDTLLQTVFALYDELKNTKESYKTNLKELLSIEWNTNFSTTLVDSSNADNIGYYISQKYSTDKNTTAVITQRIDLNDIIAYNNSNEIVSEWTTTPGKYKLYYVLENGLSTTTALNVTVK